jgi:hypothetical protein
MRNNAKLKIKHYCIDMNLTEWKWSNGQVCERSPRIRRVMNQEQTQSTQQISNQIDASTKHVDFNAHQQSLLSENDIWNMDGVQFVQDEKPLNKREDTYNKMSEREMVSQIGQNPFLPGGDYLNGVMVHEQYLKPLSTSVEKEKGVSAYE